MKDIWIYAIERARAGETGACRRPPSGPPSGSPSRNQGRVLRGRVLRVKGGYNPNSSSVGSSIPMFLTLAAGTGALAVVLLNALGVVGRLLAKQPGTDGAEPIEGDVEDEDED